MSTHMGVATAEDSISGICPERYGRSLNDVTKIGKWVSAHPAGTSKSGTTLVWNIVSGVLLGQVKWHAPWRCYAFYPDTNTIYEHDCLKSIAEFCWDATIAHRNHQHCRQSIAFPPKTPQPKPTPDEMGRRMPGIF